METLNPTLSCVRAQQDQLGHNKINSNCISSNQDKQVQQDHLELQISNQYNRHIKITSKLWISNQDNRHIKITSNCGSQTTTTGTSRSPRTVDLKPVQQAHQYVIICCKIMFIWRYTKAVVCMLKLTTAEEVSRFQCPNRIPAPNIFPWIDNCCYQLCIIIIMVTKRNFLEIE